MIQVDVAELGGQRRVDEIVRVGLIDHVVAGHVVPQVRPAIHGPLLVDVEGVGHVVNVEVAGDCRRLGGRLGTNPGGIDADTDVIALVSVVRVFTVIVIVVNL